MEAENISPAQHRDQDYDYNERIDSQEEPEAESLINNNSREGQPQNREGPGFFGIIFGYTIYPIGRGIKYIIPDFIKRGLCGMFGSDYPSEKFYEDLKENDIISDDRANRRHLAIHWEKTTFRNAVFNAYANRKPILFIMADLMTDDSKDILKAVFHDEDTLKIISENYFVFGIESGNPEANALSLEFNIREIPHFGVIMAKSDSDYDVVESFADDNVDLERFRDFLLSSFGTFKVLLEVLLSSFDHQPTGPDIYQDDRFIDFKQEEDRMIREQQKREIRLVKRKEEEEKERRKQEEKLQKEQEAAQLEIIAKELAEKKKNELPPEPEEGTTIKFREPENGNSFVRKFNPTDTVSILYDFVQSRLDEIEFESDTLIFEIGVIENRFRVLDNRERTLEEEGLCPTATLHIREIEAEEEDSEETE
ncbi:unnamed protein product [Moneuplotes crassus]|uniref:UBX domain-containing protein n=1 Tax=Euplotes crassus TaxID=5936 RepID=A0AAD1UNR3_EUPCR|nr:unnamed protein product [Moneuplotes crassus]